MLKFQFDRGCFREREASANFGVKVEYEERKKRERIEHPYRNNSECIFNVDIHNNNKSAQSNLGTGPHR